MTFQEKLTYVSTPHDERIVARFDLAENIVRFTLAAPRGTSWIYVWDNPTHPTDVRMLAHAPARNAQEATEIEEYALRRIEIDTETLIAGQN